MSQINFRVNHDEMNIIKEIAKDNGISLSEMAKRSLLKEIRSKRIELAFRYLKEGKIGFKKTWKLSGLEYEEFMFEWAKRDAKEVIPDSLLENEFRFALDFDLKKFLK